MLAKKAIGKVILSGEHAVVYGTPAIALPVFDFQAEVKISVNKEQSSPIIINAPQLKVKFHLNSISLNKNHHPIEKTVINFLNNHNIFYEVPIFIDIWSEIPISRGMGSGAAITTALIRALADFFAIKLNKKELFDEVMQIEKIYHGHPSGIDPKVIIYEEPFYFIKNKKFEPLDLNLHFVLAILDSGIRSSTKDVVNWVNKQQQREGQKYKNIFNEIGIISNNIKSELNKGNLTNIGQLMLKNHNLLRLMGVSNPVLDDLVTKSCQAGALGSKLSGAGWGGIVIALLAPEKVKAFQENLSKFGIKNCKLTFF